MGKRKSAPPAVEEEVEEDYDDEYDEEEASEEEDVAAAPAPAPAKRTAKPRKTTATTTKQDKQKRAPSVYNLYMKTELARIKKANPTMDHKAAFTAAASGWAKSKENPKNKK